MSRAGREEASVTHPTPSKSEREAVVRGRKMNATMKTNAAEGGCIAQLNFRVRCETLGHGEGVYLVRSDDPHLTRPLPLYTTESSYPWYETQSPFAISFPPVGVDETAPHVPEEQKTFQYRYAVWRAGVFYRWEQPSDGPTDVSDDVDMANNVDQIDTSGEVQYHRLPLKLLTNRETYVVNDVLGVTTGPADIDHLRLPSQTSITASSLHHRDNSSGGHLVSAGSQRSLISSASAQSTAQMSRATMKKKVGFAQVPPPYHQKTSIHKQTVHLNSTDGLVVVSVFLPVHLHRSDVGEWTADWDYEMLLSMQTHLRVTRIGVVKWRGWHGNQGPNGSGSPEAGVPRNERHKVEACLAPFNCVPVWIEPTTVFGEMYNGFCKGVLWPILHNMTSVYSKERSPQEMSDDSPSHDSNQFSSYCTDDVEQGPIHGDGGREAQYWSAYNAVNRKFAEVVVQCFNEGDLVWVHGFHLLILPSYLTRRIPMAKVGLFLHTPFPSSEIFRTLWCREDILRGMLNADQVGFHLFEYARHFLTCCRRLLGLNYGMIPDSSGGHNLAIDTNGRHVAVTSIHAGVEPQVLNQILMHTSTLEKAMNIRSQFFGKVIFCAIDRLESLKGIPLKLIGLEKFLRLCPEWVGKIVLVQVGISAFERGQDYVKTRTEVLAMVAKLNQTWPGTVQFQECAESEMRLQQRMALLRAADVVMVTPIRDGLNLIPLEFTIAHQDALTEIGKRDGRKRGLCILSEFSSCTRVMRGALHVNPWKASEIANAFHQALTISEDERLRRISCASEFVTRVTTQRWALAVMLDLKGVYKNVTPTQVSGAGLGLGFRLLGMDTGFGSLDIERVAKAFRKARSRLILVDYGGTIVDNDNLDNLKRFQMVKQSRKPSTPTDAMMSALTTLAADRRNTVFVVSGKERHFLMKTMNHIPNLGLAAEHGMFVSWPTNNMAKRRWETMVPDRDRSWRSIAINIMEVYTSRTHGSYIEETEMKVLWQYRDADLEFGFLQARELEDHLVNVLRRYAVDVLHSGVKEGGYVEVRPKGVNKGVLAMHVIQNYPKIATSPKVDFALVLGDDHCDEPMLSVMRQIGRRAVSARRAKRGDDPLPPVPATITLVDVSSCDDYVSRADLQVFTCTVGKKPSAAASYLHDVNEVQELMDSLVKVSARDRQFSSATDLSSFDLISPPVSHRARSIDVTRGFEYVDETLSSGISKSMSLNAMKSKSPGGQPVSDEIRVSGNLSDFMRLGTIEDQDDDDDAVFF